MMPRNRPAKSGYARLSQAEEDDDGLEYGDDTILSTSSPPDRQYAPISSAPRTNGSLHPQTNGSSYLDRRGSKRPTRSRRRMRSNSSVDIKAINARLEHWAEEIASKFKIRPIKGKSKTEEQLEIHHSVFQAPEGMRPITTEELHTERPGRMTREEFDDVVESVRVAIEQGVHPKMISQGSSGSYFVRNSDGKTVGVFKPKDEEPYASRNPKWTKWIHRNLFPCFFGRACLIPNLSYVSEAAAYVLDAQLRTDIVPYTDVVYLSSKVFYYDFWQRSAFYRKRKPLPEKPGSLQVFLRGFKDANIFLKEHPWPDQQNSSFRPQDAPKNVKRPWTQNCKAAILPESDDEDEEMRQEGQRPFTSGSERSMQERQFRWTPTLQQAFREQLEKLVILDYIMRNTDRGLDNWMVKIDWEAQAVSIVAEPPKNDVLKEEDDNDEPMAHPVPVTANSSRRLQVQDPYRRYEAMTPPSRGASPAAAQGPVITLGAIDNSLSWPWKHPDAWRSFPFGWLFLPVSLIGQPFSQKTRDHFLPLLTSTEWWSETQVALRRVFEMDEDFTERMFARQIAVAKGQAWNVVETLKTAGHGPLELTRRTRVCVWDDLVDVPVVREMRIPSTEMCRKTAAEFPQRKSQEEEEMDIGIMGDVPSPEQATGKSGDLLGLDTPRGDLPNPNKFELSPRQESSGFMFGGIDDYASGSQQKSRPRQDTFGSDPGGDVGGKESRAERHSQSPSTRRRPRRPSMTNRYGSFLYDPAEDEGDLGYGKTADSERNTRKVIVERLETVKSKNPVFTWC